MPVESRRNAGAAGPIDGRDRLGGALALDLWIQRRSIAQLTSVQVSDARQEVVKAYKGIADLRAEDPVDIGRQRMLTESMTAIIAQLNAATATIRWRHRGTFLAWEDVARIGSDLFRLRSGYTRYSPVLRQPE
jgi:hypothetical protein